MTDETHGVCAVTVTYGKRAELCLRTVDRALAAGVRHVVVVDNGSLEAPALLGAFQDDPRISMVRTGRNAGSAAGFAAGIRVAVRREEDSVLLLDDDNVVQTNSVAAATRLADELDDPHVIVACMRTANPLHRKIAQGLPAAAVYPPPGSFLSLDVFQRGARIFRRVTGARATATGLSTIPVAPYGGLLFSRTTLAAVGGPDPQLTLYEDDTAWTSGLTRLGYAIVLCTNAPIDDAEEKWTGDGEKGRGPLRMLRAGDRTRLYYSVRNRVLFDFGRARSPFTRVRYYINRDLFRAYLLVAGRSRALTEARAVFATAVRHGESGDLDRGPAL